MPSLRFVPGFDAGFSIKAGAASTGVLEDDAAVTSCKIGCFTGSSGAA